MSETQINVILNGKLEKTDFFKFDDAYKIISETKKKVPLVTDQRRNLSEKISIAHKGLGLLINRSLSGTLFSQNYNDKETINTMASVSSIVKVGNCGELAAVAAVEARKIKFGRIDFCSVQYSTNEQNNHIFLILNKEDGSDINKPETWGDKALILDPWREKVYKAVDFNKNDEKGLKIKYEGTYRNE